MIELANGIQMILNAVNSITSQGIVLIALLVVGLALIKLHR